MVKNLYLIIIVYLCISCAKYNEISTPNFDKEIYGEIADSQSKTFLDTDLQICWMNDDKISVFEGDNFNKQYSFVGEDGATRGSFRYIAQNQNTETSNISLNAWYAIYPYQENTIIDGNSTITYELPSSQDYIAENIPINSCVMIGATENNSSKVLRFRNIMGCLKLKLYGENTTISKIKVSGNNDEKLSGNINISYSYSDIVPVLKMKADAKSYVELGCLEGLTISSEKENPTIFYLCLPPTEFTKGFTVEVTNDKGFETSFSTSKSITIERNSVQPMAVKKIEFPKEPNYITFESDSFQQLSIDPTAFKSLEYCTDKKWVPIEDMPNNLVWTKISLRALGKINDETTISFSNNSPVKCHGDIRTLLNFRDVESCDSGVFKNLFKDCLQLTSAPELPATTLSTGCYANMFNGCRRLTAAPKLPAMILADSCYYQMFYACESLTTAPELPATTLAVRCYQGIFQNCHSLTTAPSLPATTLADHCYQHMFSHTSILQTPELPATTLADHCYGGMFYSCISLTTAPKLPATTLAPYCYSSMFSECQGLINAPELPAMILTPHCYDFMFHRCLKLRNAPKLPATSLAEGCYYGMFASSAIYEAPELPAKKLCDKCYARMFRDSYITKIKIYFSSWNKSSTEDWLDLVPENGTFECPSQLPIIRGTSNIPNSWVVRTFEDGLFNAEDFDDLQEIEPSTFTK